MRQQFPNVYVSLGNFYHDRREARRALLAQGAPAPEHDTIALDGQCARCRRPTAASITFRFNRAGDPISHELLPASSHCPDCGLPFHSRNLLYVSAIRQALVAEPPTEAIGETGNPEPCVALAAS